jgi:hypothetical protein
VLVVSILKGETSVAEAARTYGLTVAEVEDWREKFLLGAENALRTRPKDEDAVESIKGSGNKNVPGIISWRGRVKPGGCAAAAGVPPHALRTESATWRPRGPSSRIPGACALM